MRSILIFWLLVTGLAQAQTRKPDTIIKTNAASLTGYVVRVTDGQVQYRLLAKTDAAIYSLPRSQVRAIRYSSGKTVLLTARTPSPVRPAPANPSVLPSDVSRPQSATVAPVTAPLPPVSEPAVSTPKPEPLIPALLKTGYRYTAVTLGAEGNYVIPALSPQWADDAIGLGIRQGMGASLLVTRRFNRWVGLSVQLGYGRWETERLYRQTGVVIYSSDEKLQRIPVQLGLKLYLVQRLYLLPQGNAQWVSLHSTTSETNVIPRLNTQQNTIYLGYGGQLGYELNAGKMMVDVSLGYYVLHTSTRKLISFYTLTNQLHFVGVRVSAGFVTFR